MIPRERTGKERERKVESLFSSRGSRGTRKKINPRTPLFSHVFVHGGVGAKPARARAEVGTVLRPSGLR